MAYLGPHTERLWDGWTPCESRAEMHARLVDAVSTLLTRPWRGTATEMLAHLRLPLGAVDPRWPPTPRALSAALHAIRPALRARRVSVTWRRTTGGVQHVLVTSGRDDGGGKILPVDVGVAVALSELDLPWSGTVRDLWSTLAPRDPWPRSVDHLGRVLRRGAAFAAADVEVIRSGRILEIRRAGVYA